MVTILSVAFTAPTGIEHERCTSPLMCTEQAPHCATPQPYLVPVRPTCSRITHSSGVSGSTCTSRTLPLMLSFAIEASLVKDACGRRSNDRHPGPRGFSRRAVLGLCGKPSATTTALPTPVWNNSMLPRGVEEL